MIVETKRLILRELNINDAEDIYNNWASDDNVTKYLTWNAHKDISITRLILEQWIKEYKIDGIFRYGIVLKETNELIGMIDTYRRVNNALEIGYVLTRKYWNNGYMSEALRAFVTNIFSKGYKKVIIGADSNNKGSIRVIEKNGFVFDSVVKGNIKGKEVDIIYYYKVFTNINHIPQADVDMLVLDKYEQ